MNYPIRIPLMIHESSTIVALVNYHVPLRCHNLGGNHPVPDPFAPHLCFVSTSTACTWSEILHFFLGKLHKLGDTPNVWFLNSQTSPFLLVKSPSCSNHDFSMLESPWLLATSTYWMVASLSLTMKSQLFATFWIPWMVEIIYFCSGIITMFGFVLTWVPQYSMVWVNYNISLPWIVEPFWDGSPNPNYDYSEGEQWGRD